MIVCVTLLYATIPFGTETAILRYTPKWLARPLLNLHGLCGLGTRNNNSGLAVLLSGVSASRISRMGHGLTSEVGRLSHNDTGNLGISLSGMSESIERGLHFDVMTGGDHLKLHACVLEPFAIDCGGNHLPLAGSEPLHDFGSD